MNHDFSFEDQITDGIIQIIKSITADFNKVSIVFENKNNSQQKLVQFNKVIFFSMNADFADEYNDDMDIMAYRTLIGFSRVENTKCFHYCMKTDDYEFEIKSYEPVSLTRI